MLASTLAGSQGGSGIDGFVSEWGLNACRTGDDPKVLAALQTFLDAVSPEAGYVLGFAPEGTAVTSFAAKRVTVTSEALREATAKALNFGGRSAGTAFRTTAGFVLHEVGHIRYSQDNGEVVHAAFAGKPDESLAHTLSNILDENRIERAMGRDFPGYADVFEDVIRWYVERHPDGRTPKCITDGDGTVRTRAEAFDVLAKAARFDRYTRWGYDPSASLVAARAFGRLWGRKYAADDSTALHLAGVRAAIEWLRAFPKKVESDQPTEPEPGQGEGSDAQGQDENGQPGPGGQGGQPSEPQPGERPTDLTIEGDEPDEDEDEAQGNGASDGKDADEGTESEPDESESEGEGGESGLDATDDGEPSSDGKPSGDESGADLDGDDEGEGSDEPSESESEGEGGDSKVGGASTDEPTLDEVPEVPDLDKAIAPTDADKAFDKKAEREREKTSFDPGTAVDGLGLTTIINQPTFNPYATTQAGGAPDAVAVDAMAEAFTNTRLSNETYGGGFSSGRFRNGSVQRILNGSLNALYRRTLPSITHLHLALVIDWSGSMAATYSTDRRAEKANALAVNIEAALQQAPEVRLSVYHYTGDGQQVTRVWTTGDRVDLAFAVTHVPAPSGGTPTAAALDTVANLVEADTRPGEYPLILSITDGEPNSVPGYAESHEPVRRVCDYWRRRGIGILGLGVGSVDVRDIEDQYGTDAAVTFNGDWTGVGIDLAEVVGGLLYGQA